MVLLGTAHESIRVVNTKLKLMKLKLCTWELRLETRINWVGILTIMVLEIILVVQKRFVVFCNAKHYMCNVGMKRSMCHNL